MRSLASAMAGLVWSLLGLSKALAPDAFMAYVRGKLGTAGASIGDVVAWAIITLELGLGTWMFVGGVRRAPSRRLCVASLAASIALLAVSVVVRDAVACGCFGAIVAASFGRRVFAAGALIFLSASSLQAKILRPRDPSPDAEGRESS